MPAARGELGKAPDPWLTVGSGAPTPIYHSEMSLPPAAVTWAVVDSNVVFNGLRRQRRFGSWVSAWLTLELIAVLVFVIVALT